MIFDEFANDFIGFAEYPSKRRKTRKLVVGENIIRVKGYLKISMTNIRVII